MPGSQEVIDGPVIQHTPVPPLGALPRYEPAPDLVTLLVDRARAHPDRLAFRFLAGDDPDLDDATPRPADGFLTGAFLTYGELDRRARAIAARLQSQAAKGDRAMLLYAPGLDFVEAFWGCLYAGLVPVPVYPPRDAKALAPLLGIARDAQCRLALTSRDVLGRTRIERWFLPALRAMRWLATDEAPDTGASGWQPPSCDAKTLALLQYTSGSTGDPKGVMVGHGHLLANVSMLQAAWDASGFAEPGPGTFVSWLPVYHDMGLIGMVIAPVAMGASSVLMSPLLFLQRPWRWLAAISRHRGVVTAGPNFAYDLCVRKIAAEERGALDLSSWLVAMNGAEPVRAKTLTDFTEAFGPAGFRAEAFYPCYGLAEATVFVSGGLGRADPVVRPLDTDKLSVDGLVAKPSSEREPTLAVGCGQAWLDQRIVVVDPLTCRPCPTGHVGEIWVAGPGVAAGYWRRPELSEQVFGAYMEGSDSGPYMRTGDLGFWADGELFVTGRLKDLIIVRGRNHYPQDIERTVEQAHPALRAGCGAAFEATGPQGDGVVIVVEIDRRAVPPEPAAVERAIRLAVVDHHEVPVHGLLLLAHGTLPKTSSGKVQRGRCRTLYLAGRLQRWQP